MSTNQAKSPPSALPADALPCAVPEVLWIGDFPFPTGSPGANNLRAHCRAIQEAGYTVGMLPFQKAGRPQDLGPDGVYRYLDFPYWSVCPPLPKRPMFGLQARLFGLEDERFAWLERHATKGVKAIIIYQGFLDTSRFALRLLRFCRRHGIKIFHYTVEWQRVRQLSGRWRYLDALDAAIHRRWVNPKLTGTICLADCLEDFFRPRGCKTVVVPALLDLSDPVWAPFAAKAASVPVRPVRLLFSGTFARDRQDLILKGVKQVRDKGGQVFLEYLGSTREKLAALPEVGQALVDSLGEGIRFHGRVPDDQVYPISASATFLIMLREQAWWSNVAFPSRFPEFAALGVPTMSTLASDMGKYLVDGKNGMVIPELSAESFARTIERTLQLSDAQLQGMRVAALEMAKLFDASRFAGVYRDLLA